MNFATVNGVTLRYTTAGSGGTPLVFINSLGTNLHIWDAVAACFPHVQTVRYDKRGHGLSDAPPAPYAMRDHSDDLRALLDHLQIERATLIGVSVGGMIALDFAAQHPQRVASLVLCDTAGKIGDAAGWNARIDALEQNGMMQLAEPILDRWFAPDVGGAMRCIGRNMLTRTTLAGYVGTCAAIRDADLRPTLAALSMPALVLCGAQDSATPPELVKTLAVALPNATFQTIDGAGHLPCWEQPTATAAAIKAFLSAQPNARYETGMAIRRSVLGDAHVERASGNITEFDADFQRFITEFAWGTAWAGDSIDKKTRHLITLAIIAALGKEHEFGMHVRATQNTGVTPDELKQALHHVAIYAGVPSANTAIGIAKKIYKELEIA
ncbi:MAG: 3-oxoadipate enol-lactonase [Candidatus Promineifilaceae bacterium]